MIKNIVLSGILMFAGSNIFAQHSLEKLWESDSLTLKSPESVLYDAKSNSLYVSNMGAGSIVRMDLQGKIIEKDWITGLKSNKGSALYKGMLYTAETSEVTIIDVDKASILKRIPIEGAGMLNDLVVDSKGVVYVSDTRTGKVHRIEGDKPTVFLENLTGVNGLLLVKNDLYVLTSNSVQKVTANKEITKIADGFENGLDGIVMVGDKEFVISNYRGLIYYLKADGTKQTLLDTRSNRISANDIGFNPKTKTLYVAEMSTHRIVAYKVK